MRPSPWIFIEINTTKQIEKERKKKQSENYEWVYTRPLLHIHFRDIFQEVVITRMTFPGIEYNDT